jgi:hypothetical protein
MDYMKNQKPSNESLENLSLQMLLIKPLILLNNSQVESPTPITN